MYRNSSVALACALSMCGSSAFAAAESSASIKSLNFELIDLNPADGAASFSFGGVGATQLSLNTNNSTQGESDAFSKTRAGTFNFSQTFSSDLTNVSARASIGQQELSAAGKAVGSGTSYNATASTGLSSPYYYYPSNGNLSLSAHSMLIVTAEASAFASATNPSGTCYYYCSPSEQASANVGMSLNYSYSSGSTSMSYSFNDALSLTAQATVAYTSQEFKGIEWVPYTDYWGNTYYQYQPIFETVEHPLQEQTSSATKYLTAVFLNTSDTTQTASLLLNVSASGFASTGEAAPLVASMSTVPEADGYALFLAGLSVTGFIMLRRRVR